jgi:hypothetical protein
MKSPSPDDPGSSEDWGLLPPIFRRRIIRCPYCQVFLGIDATMDDGAVSQQDRLPGLPLLILVLPTEDERSSMTRNHR